MDAVGADQDVTTCGVSMRAATVEEIGCHPALVLGERPKAAARVHGLCTEPLEHGLMDNALQSATMDRKLRHVVAGIKPTLLMPDLLPVASQVEQLGRADSDAIKPIEQADPGELADRMGQRVDANPEFANGLRLFEQLAVNATRPQHQRGGEAADTAAYDNRLHGPYSPPYATACQGRTATYSAASGFRASSLSSARVFGLALIFRSSKSCRSRALLRKICSLPGRYCGGQNIPSAPYQAAAFIVKKGSTRCGRPRATRSARPAAKMVLT